MDSSGDRIVLLEFFRATNGPLWRRNEGWGTSENLSTWYGVEVDEDGRVVKLELPANDLKGPVPDSLGLLVNLMWLILSSNRLIGDIPESLGHLTNLTTLGLQANHLYGAIPESLGHLTNLSWLDVSSNQLTGTIPNSLGQLRNVNEINLSSNRLIGAIPTSLGQLTNVKRLHLSSNQLTGAIPTSLGQLTEVDDLYLSSNRLTGVIPESLGQLTNVTMLDLSSNRLTGAIPTSLGQLTNMERLDLSSNQLTGESPRWTEHSVIPESLGQLTNVTLLDLSSNRLTDSSSPCMKLFEVVLVGAVKAGKTSLVNGMIHGEPRLCHEDDRTKGVDVHVAEPCKPDAEEKLELIFWDFAGHSEYSSTHQVFLSRGALHLLVVDLKRFADEPSLRGELVDVWLDALQCRVPGSSVLVVATQIDRFTGHLEAALGDLRRIVEAHPSVKKRNELEQTRNDTWTPSDAQQKLIFHGVETVSSTRSESLIDLRSKLLKLVHTKRYMFPSVGQQRPVSWGRVCAMLDAIRSGKDPILQAFRVGTVEQDQGYLETTTTGVTFLHRADAIDKWRQVVRTLKLEKEVGSTVWDITLRKFKRGVNITRKGKKAVFEDAVGQLVREGTILDADKVLYLEPTWINDLLRAILDHDLADVTKEDFWEHELEKFCCSDRNMCFDLKKIHDNFPSTGILTIGYLRFLWREIDETRDKALFESLVSTMSSFGVIFQGNPSGTSLEGAGNRLHESTELFVPLHLPSTILESDLGELEMLLKYQSRKELVYEIHQPYVPPGILGLLMAQFLPCENVKFRKCWSRGAVFTQGEVLVMLYLDTPSHSTKTEITVNLFGERFVSEFTKAMETVEHKIKSMFFKRFDGLAFYRKSRYPREVNGVRATGGRFTVDSTSAADIINAVIARIDGLEAHLDREMSLLLRGLRLLEYNLHDVVETCHSTLLRLNRLQLEEVPYPRLVIVRPAAAVMPVGVKRSLKTMIKGLGRRAKKLVCKDMRLCFLCPYDFSEVACGLHGNGYPITTVRDWVIKIRPALKVTAVLAKVAIKAASGLDVPVSEFLNGAKSYLGEELADRVLDDSVVERALNGRVVPGEGGDVKALVGEAYEELKKFMTEQKNNSEGYVHFNELMQIVDDGEGGKVWVSNENVAPWENAHK